MVFISWELFWWLHYWFSLPLVRWLFCTVIVAELKLILFVSVLLSLQPVSKKKKEKERCSLLVEKLKDEFKLQEEHNQRVMASLKHERDSWLPASKCILALFLEQSEINFWKGVFSVFARVPPGCIPYRPRAEVTPRALKMYAEKATILRCWYHTTPYFANNCPGPRPFAAAKEERLREILETSSLKRCPCSLSGRSKSIYFSSLRVQWSCFILLSHL